MDEGFYYLKKVVMKLDGTPFTNSDICKGVSFGDTNLPLDIARIEISGRYPEQGWAMNHESHEIVYIVDGDGLLEQEGKEPISLAKDEAIYVPPDQPFAWNGHMTIIMACNPAFTSSQYELRKGEPA